MSPKAPALFAALIVLSSSALGQNSESGLARLNFMVGEWRGTARGESGEGTVERACSKVLNDRFIECRTTVTYPAQKANPKGEVHVERAFFSFDRKSKKLRLRQFHGEGLRQQLHRDGSAFVRNDGDREHSAGVARAGNVRASVA